MGKYFAYVSSHWGLDKVADILQMAPSNAFSSMKIFIIWLNFLLRLFLKFWLTILVQMVAWHKTGDKPLSESLLV